MPKTILAFGELLWDLFPTGEVLGGAPANFAYRIQSLGDQTHLISRLGRDERGRRAAELLSQKGLSTENLQWDDQHPTGTVPITMDANGHHDFTILPDVAYDFIELNSEISALAQKADAICFGTLIQRNEPSRRTLYQLLDTTRTLRVLDLNLRKDCYNHFTIDSSLKRADILKLNEDEALHLSRAYGIDPLHFCTAAVRKWNLKCCVVTRGANGAEAASATEFTSVSAPKLTTPVVDTVGCGDAFTAMFLHHYLTGAELGECIEKANQLAAAVSRTRGGMEPVNL